MATYALTINGSSVVPQIKSVRITAPANGSATLECAYNVASAASAPAIDDEVILTENGTAIFGGYVASVTTRGYGGEPTSGMTLDIVANDYNQLADRRYIGTLIGGVAFLAGTTLKDALTVIVAYIPGASLHASQVNGPTFSDNVIVYSQMVRATLDQMTQLTGYVWQIDADKKLRMYAPGDIAAPFNIANNDGQTIGDIRVKPTRDDFANRVFVLGSGVIGIAEDAVSVAADGDHEYCAQSEDITDQAQADALAATILDEKLQTLKEIEYSTRQLGLAPGQTQTVVNTARGVNATFTITQVVTEYYTGTQAIRHVTAIEGSTFKATWQQKTAQMFSGSFNSGTASTSGGSIPRASVTLTNAQIKALPTTPIVVVPAPGTGKRIKVLAATVSLENSSGGYTNIDTQYAGLYLVTEAGTFAGANGWVSGAVVNDDGTLGGGVAYANPVTDLTDFLGGTDSPVVDLPAAYLDALVSNIASGLKAWTLPNPTLNRADVDDQGVQVVIDNNGSGDLTGGNAANTMKVTVYYATESL